VTEGSNRPPRKYYYCAFKQTFEELGDGKVKVTAEDGRTGIFRWDGPYIEGDLTEANIHMLNWTGGPTVPPECNFRWSTVPTDPSRPSGWPEPLERTLKSYIEMSS
jgi:hypothetical protein